jgi:hypothetical protein
VNAWLTNFVGGVFNLLFLIGRPGLSKSQRALHAIGERRHAWIECHATKLALYCKLYEHRDEPVIIDDENSLVADPGKLALMNSLCQTNPVKTLRWDSTTRLLEERRVPTEFRTGSPVLVITNRLRNITPQIAAMIDRGQPLLFEPPAAEVHRAVADWFPDKEVYDFIGKWLPFIPDLSMRDYVKARQMKKAELDWQSLLHRQWKSSRLARVAALRADPSFATEEDRVQAFVAHGGSRATYFRDVARLRRLGSLSPAPGETLIPPAPSHSLSQKPTSPVNQEKDCCAPAPASLQTEGTCLESGSSLTAVPPQ